MYKLTKQYMEANPGRFTKQHEGGCRISGQPFARFWDKARREYVTVPCKS